MSKAAKTIPDAVPTKSGCGCSSETVAIPGETTAADGCGSGHDRPDHRDDGQGHHGPARGSDGHAPQGPARGALPDPVCGMAVDPSPSRHHFDYSGKPYHFCSAG